MTRTWVEGKAGGFKSLLPSPGSSHRGGGGGVEGGERHRCSFRKMVILIKRQTNEHSTDCLRAKLLKSHQGVGSHSGKEGCLPHLPARIGAEASYRELEKGWRMCSLQTAKAGTLRPLSRGQSGAAHRQYPGHSLPQPQGGAGGGAEKEPAIGHPLLWAGLWSSCFCFSCILLNKAAILQVRTLRLREGEWLVQGHTARTWLM